MRKDLLLRLLLCFGILSINASVFTLTSTAKVEAAKQNVETEEVKNTRETIEFQNEYYQDALLSLLFPSLNKAITKKYGEQKQYICPTITDMKRVYPNSYVFEIIVQARKHESGQKPPYELITATYNNQSGVYKLVDFQTKELSTNEIPKGLKCKQNRK